MWICWWSGRGRCLGCWERFLNRWWKSRYNGNLESIGSGVLCEGERGRGWGGRRVSGCFVDPEVD